MDRTYNVYGHIVIAVWDANDEQRQAFSTTPDGLHEMCPRCDTTVGETDARCPSCGLLVIWENSRPWRLATDQTAKRLWDNARQRPFGKAEQEALNMFSATVWAKGTLHNLNQLRSLSEPWEFTSKHSDIARRAISQTQSRGKAAQNYFLVSLYRSLAPDATEKLPDTTPQPRYERLF